MQELNGKNSPSLVTCRIKNWERRSIERGGGGEGVKGILSCLIVPLEILA